MARQGYTMNRMVFNLFSRFQIHASLNMFAFSEFVSLTLQTLAFIAFGFGALHILSSQRKTPRRPRASVAITTGAAEELDQKKARLVALELLHLYGTLKQIDRRSKQRRQGFRVFPPLLKRNASAPATI